MGAMALSLSVFQKYDQLLLCCSIADITIIEEFLWLEIVRLLLVRKYAPSVSQRSNEDRMSVMRHVQDYP